MWVKSISANTHEEEILLGPRASRFRVIENDPN
jgi:hypothetical protein